MPRRVLTLLLLLAAPAFGQNRVVFPDGFELRGKHGKEPIPTDLDSLFGGATPCDYLNAGPRFVYFAKHDKKGIVLGEEKAEKPVEYRRADGSQGIEPMPKAGRATKVTEFNGDGRRTITFSLPGFPDVPIVQVANFITPKYVFVGSATHRVRQVYGTKEFGPQVVRDLLANHPDLRDGWLPVPDPIKRMKLAAFLLEVGWREEARAELAKLKKDVTGAWAKDAADQYDKLSAAIDTAEANWVAGELNVALAAGQYELAERVLDTYKPAASGAEELKAFAALKARVSEVRPKFEAAKKALRLCIDIESGAAERHPHTAVVGFGAVVVPAKPIPLDLAPLLEGAEAVLAELHPDTLRRVEAFTQVADDIQRALAAGREPRTKPRGALALAVSGWLRGGGGGETSDPALAIKMWRTRKMAVTYLNEQGYNTRSTILAKWQKSDDKLEPAELAQIVTFLPPIAPFDPADKSVRAVDVKTALVPDVYRIDSGSLPDDPKGVTYYVRLPREYKPGRAYPVVVALHPGGQDAVDMIARLASEADRRGVIVAAPQWGSAFKYQAFNYDGTDSRPVMACVRDLSRRFTVDQDRVFAWGYGEGATLALDLSMSRPDLFAGVVSFSPNPQHQFYRETAGNAQKLAVYAVTGELDPAVFNLRNVFQNWLPYGYYAILCVYKGRASEWFAQEVPTVFDWMEPKRRKRGLQALRMDGGTFDAWRTVRANDDRFYWVGPTDVDPGRLTKPDRPDNPRKAAFIQADILKGNQIVVKAEGMKKVTVWLERDMIDWDKDVYFKINSATGQVKPTKLTPDVPFMMEELYRTGDRKMLFFGKYEFKLIGG